MVKINHLDNNLKLEGKRVLLRVDFNVPLNNGSITEASRIQKVLRTIKFLIDNKAKSNLGEAFELDYLFSEITKSIWEEGYRDLMVVQICLRGWTIQGKRWGTPISILIRLCMILIH